MESWWYWLLFSVAVLLMVAAPAVLLLGLWLTRQDDRVDAAADDTRTLAMLLEQAWAVAGILNGIDDDDEREAALDKFDNAVRANVHIGRQNITVADALIGATVGLLPSRPELGW